MVNHAGRLISSGEVGWPYELDPADLSTVGPLDYGGQVRTNFTAHPKIDPDTGLMHAFGYGFVPPFLTYYVMSADGSEVVHRTDIDVAGPTMIHDFAITDRDAVFWELPVVFDFEAAVAGEAFPFAWEPEYGSRLGVLPLGADGSAIRWVEIDDGYVFHGTNAWRDGDRIHLDVNRIDRVLDTDGIDGGPSLLTPLDDRRRARRLVVARRDPRRPAARPAPDRPAPHRSSPHAGVVRPRRGIARQRGVVPGPRRLRRLVRHADPLGLRPRAPAHRALLRAGLRVGR